MAQLMDYTQYLAEEIGPRPAGTEEEHQAALYITEQFQKEAGFTAVIEEFASSSNLEGGRAILAGVTIVVTVLAMVFPILAIPAFILAAAAAAIYSLEAIDRPIISRALSRGASQNVVAKYQPNPDAEASGRAHSRKLIVVAHYDTGRVRPALMRRLESLGLPLTLICVIAMLASAVFLLLRIFVATAGGGALVILNVLSVVALIVCLIPVLDAILTRLAPYNEGANNNATGTAALIEVARRISRGSVSEADLAKEDDGEVVIHGEEAARSEGLVPEGAQIRYEAEQIAPPSEFGEYDEEERLLAAKAAIAALTGKPVERKVYGSVADKLVNSRLHESESGEVMTIPGDAQPEPAEFDDYSHPAPSEYEPEGSFAVNQPMQATFAEEVPEQPPAQQSEAEGFENAPSWFIAAQQNAKKAVTDEPVEIHRSRYTEAMERGARDRQERLAAEFQAGQAEQERLAAEQRAIEEQALAQAEAATASARQESLAANDQYRVPVDQFSDMQIDASIGAGAPAPDAAAPAPGEFAAPERKIPPAPQFKFEPAFDTDGVGVDFGGDPLAEQARIRRRYGFDDQEPEFADESAEAPEAINGMPSVSAAADADAGADEPDFAGQPVYADQAAYADQAGRAEQLAYADESGFEDQPGYVDQASAQVDQAGAQAEEPVIDVAPELAKPGQTQAFPAYAELDAAAEEASRANDEFRAGAHAAPSFDEAFEPAEFKSTPRHAISLPELDLDEPTPRHRVTDLPSIGQSEISSDPSRSGKLRKIRTNVPSLSGVVRTRDEKRRAVASSLPNVVNVPTPIDVAPARETPSASGDDFGAHVAHRRSSVVEEVDYDMEVPADLAADMGFEERAVSSGAQAAGDQPASSRGSRAGEGQAYDERSYDEEQVSASVPRSRAGSFLNRFRHKEDDLSDTPQEWLDVDDDFDARSVGRARGSWESFRDEDYDEAPADVLASPEDDFADDGADGASGDAAARGRKWEGGAYSRMQLGHVDMRSGEDAEADEVIPDEPPEAEVGRSITGEIEQIYHFRNPSFNTEIWFVAMGSDTESHDGAKAFLEEHRNELRGSMIIEVESLGAGDLSVASQEGSMKKVAASSRIKRLTREAVAKTGVDLDEVSLVGTDSIASTIQKAGFQSMHLFGAENGRPALKGSADDVMDNVDEYLLDEHVNFLFELLKNRS